MKIKFTVVDEPARTVTISGVDASMPVTFRDRVHFSTVGEPAELAREGSVDLVVRPGLAVPPRESLEALVPPPTTATPT